MPIVAHRFLIWIVERAIMQVLSEMPAKVVKLLMRRQKRAKSLNLVLRDATKIFKTSFLENKSI